MRTAGIAVALFTMVGAADARADEPFCKLRGGEKCPECQP